MTPTFKTIDDGFTSKDFDEFPVWIWCVMEDEGKEWYDEVCERTYRGEKTGLPLNELIPGLYEVEIETVGGSSLLGIGRWQGLRLSLLEIFHADGNIRLKHHRDEKCEVDSGIENDITKLETHCDAKVEQIFPLTVRTKSIATLPTIETQCFGFELLLFENRLPIDGKMIPDYE